MVADIKQAEERNVLARSAPALGSCLSPWEKHTSGGWWLLVQGDQRTHGADLDLTHVPEPSPARLSWDQLTLSDPHTCAFKKQIPTILQHWVLSGHATLCCVKTPDTGLQQRYGFSRLNITTSSISHHMPSFSFLPDFLVRYTNWDQ